MSQAVRQLFFVGMMYITVLSFLTGKDGKLLNTIKFTGFPMPMNRCISKAVIMRFPLRWMIFPVPWSFVMISAFPSLCAVLSWKEKRICFLSLPPGRRRAFSIGRFWDRQERWRTRFTCVPSTRAAFQGKRSTRETRCFLIPGGMTSAVWERKKELPLGK